MKIHQVNQLLEKTLPQKMIEVMNAYDTFTNQIPPDDAKSFGAYHLACKNALAHLMTLVKLYALFGQKENSNETIGDSWLEKAKQAVDLFNKQDDEDDEE